MNAPHPTAQSRQQLYRDMEPHNLTPLWEVLHALVPQSPTTPCVPAFWQYDRVRPFLTRAGEAITAEEAVRRVLILENPKLRGQSAVTQSLFDIIARCPATAKAFVGMFAGQASCRPQLAGRAAHGQERALRTCINNRAGFKTPPSLYLKSYASAQAFNSA